MTRVKGRRSNQPLLLFPVLELTAYRPGFLLLLLAVIVLIILFLFFFFCLLFWLFLWFLVGLLWFFRWEDTSSTDRAALLVYG